MPNWLRRRLVCIRGLRKWLCLASIGIALTVLTGGAVAKPADISESEMKLLPRYCKDTQGFGYGDAYSNTSPRARRWVALMGSTFWHMHHYCWAEINMIRSRKARLSDQQRNALLQAARNDYWYVPHNAPPDFILLPEIYTRIGQVELLLENPGKANEAFMRARKLKPDYWPAYTHWAEFLIHKNQRAEALKIVREGLENAPRSKVLLEQYRLLGGKKSVLTNAEKSPQPIEPDTTQDDE